MDVYQSIEKEAGKEQEIEANGEGNKVRSKIIGHESKRTTRP